MWYGAPALDPGLGDLHCDVTAKQCHHTLKRDSIEREQLMSCLQHFNLRVSDLTLLGKSRILPGTAGHFTGAASPHRAE
jgi:hypothetical protein